MAIIEFELVVNAPLEKVWAFHQDAQSLAKLSPAEDAVKIESADEPIRQGSRIVISVKGPMGRRMKWVARIVEHKPPHAVVFGEEARFVDEQEQGPFARWRHEHEFERVDEKRTRVIDRITYRVGWGPVGWIADALYVRPKLARMFRYRHEQTRRLLDEKRARPVRLRSRSDRRAGCNSA